MNLAGLASRRNNLALGIEIQRGSDLPLNGEIVRDWRGVW
jgi:hypothetical protein